MVEGVGGLEAHVLLALDMDMPAENFGRIHHLPAAQLVAVIDGMRDRGLIGDDGWLSEQGRAVKQRVESLTDDLAAKPYESLEPGELDELMATLEPLAAPSYSPPRTSRSCVMTRDCPRASRRFGRGLPLSSVPPTLSIVPPAALAEEDGRLRQSHENPADSTFCVAGFRRSSRRGTTAGSSLGNHPVSRDEDVGPDKVRLFERHDVSIIFGEKDRYLTPRLARTNAPRSPGNRSLRGS